MRLNRIVPAGTVSVPLSCRHQKPPVFVIQNLPSLCHHERTSVREGSAAAQTLPGINKKQIPRRARDDKSKSDDKIQNRHNSIMPTSQRQLAQRGRKPCRPCGMGHNAATHFNEWDNTRPVAALAAQRRDDLSTGREPRVNVRRISEPRSGGTVQHGRRTAAGLLRCYRHQIRSDRVAAGCPSALP